MPFREIVPNVFLWPDVCNVYVLRDGDAAILIDLGDGSVLDALPQIGIKNVEWVLFTHHHREQCMGAPRLKNSATKFAAPEIERAFFENPTSFRKLKPKLGDAHSVYGASYVRPPIEALKIERTFKTMDDFQWRGNEFWCVDTRGNSPGGMSYMLNRGGQWLAFSGDVMLEGARMHNYFDSEWDYGFGAGLYALYNSAALLERFRPAWLLPSHGAPIPAPAAHLKTYQEKLRKLVKLVLRGYELNTFAGADQDRVSKPTSVPHVWQISPHLYKFKGPNFWPNFTLIKADSGRALIVDCGLFDKTFLDKALGLMKERLGIVSFDAVIVTHMHGDHFLEAPHLREKWGAQLWTMDLVAEKCQFPEHFDLAAPINSYGAGFESTKFDRLLRNGETIRWEGYEFTADWMPGQTAFALCLHGQIDGKLVAFTGDNIFASTTDPAQNGHEAVVAHNSGMLEEGYLFAANYLHGLQPDLIVGGHSWVMDEPRKLIERYRQGAVALREALQDVSTDEDYRYTFDPYWVRAYPYRLQVQPGTSAEFVLNIRNFRERRQTHKIVVRTPEGLTANPAIIEGALEADDIARVKVTLKADAGIKDGVCIVSFDTTVDDKRYGEWFDMMVSVGNPAADQPAAPAEPKKGY